MSERIESMETNDAAPDRTKVLQVKDADQQQVVSKQSGFDGSDVGVVAVEDMTDHRIMDVLNQQNTAQGVVVEDISQRGSTDETLEGLIHQYDLLAQKNGGHANMRITEVDDTVIDQGPWKAFAQRPGVELVRRSKTAVRMQSQQTASVEQAA